MSDLKPLFILERAESDQEPKVFFPATPFAGAHVSDLSSYHALYESSINDSDAFWATVTAQLHFQEYSSKGLEYNLDVRNGKVFTRFMAGAKTNLSYNCLERNIARGLGEKVAFMWEGNEIGDQMTITYQQLLDKVVAFSSVLRSFGLQRGEVVAMYLPMVVELAIAMLACARIGVVHSVVFAGFSAEALAARIVDANCRVVITADGSFRGTKAVHLKPIVDEAARIAQRNGVMVEKAIILEHFKRVTVPAGAQLPKDCEPICTEERDELWSTVMDSVKGEDSAVEWMESEDPLFILYTSGSTGKPKGILHTTAGYMTYAYQTTKMTFDVHADTDVYWCTADCGWVTGHTNVVYGPLLNGLSSVFFEGVPTYPDAGRMWSITQKYKITKMYTSPTAVRALQAKGDSWVEKYDRSSLRVIGVAGEPINPKAWMWLHEVVGNRKAVVIDTYWQTETGGNVISPLPGATPLKPGSATFPFFGIEAVILDHDGRIIEGPGEGNLCFARAWPGMLRGVWRDEERFETTYFTRFPGYYFTGDGARRDEDGYIWLTGRVDDLMNVCGHLLSTAEIESALAAHPKVAEAAVVAAPHDIKGSFPYAFVTMNQRIRLTLDVILELKQKVERVRMPNLLQLCRVKIGSIAVPDVIQEAHQLPKTRSGKVTRRILRKIVEGSESGLGDTTTLVDESVIDQLIIGRSLSPPLLPSPSSVFI